MSYTLGDRIFFMHLPKTAGTTLKAYLADMFAAERVCPVVEHVALRALTEAQQLSRYDLFQGHFTYEQLPPELREQCKFLTFLRHPLARVVSEYYQWSRRPEIFTDEIKALLLRSHNAQTIMLSPLSQADGRISMADHLAATKELLESYLFVGVQERFGECLQALALVLKRPVPETLPKLNVGRNKQAVVPGRSEDEILSSNWADLELHRYATALFERKFKLPDTLVPGMYQSMERYAGAAPRKLHYRMEQPLIGSGWYEREGLDSDAPQCWRWSGPGTESYIDLALAQNRSYRVTLRILNAVSSEVLQSVRLFVNDHAVVLRDFQPRWWQWRRPDPTLDGWLYEGTVKARHLQRREPFVRVRLQVGQTLNQRVVDPDTGLDRQCGIAVTEINFD